MPAAQSSLWRVLQGEWQDEDGTVVLIADADLCFPDGAVLELVEEGENACSFSIGSEVFKGQVSSDGFHITWNDGDRWVRNSPAPTESAAAVEVAKHQSTDDNGLGGKSSGDSMAATASVTGKTTILVSHAVEDHMVEVVLPKRARVRHIKLAVSKLFGDHESMRTAVLMRKTRGSYRSLKDLDPIADLRRVFVVRADFAHASGQQAELSDAEVSQDEGLDEGTSSNDTISAREDLVRIASEPFTLQHAVRLQIELLQRFREPSFRQKLDDLEVLRGKDATELARSRQEVLLSAQSCVLPRYGFEGSQLGVHHMMSQCGPFLRDPEFQRLAAEINHTIGIDMPPETWERRVEHSKRLVATTQPPEGARQRRSPGIARQCLAITGGYVMGRAAPRGQAVTDGSTELFAAACGTREATATVVRVKPWPPEQPPPFKLFVAGTWDDYDPDEMKWESGCFSYPVMIRKEGWESFQFLINGEWSKTVYPSIPDATPLEAHSVLGPDGSGHGMNWQIGKAELTRPGMLFVIIAQLDASGAVQMVQWQPHVSH